MLVLRRLRQYHAVLAILVVLAYLTGEAGIVHAWLGYAVAVIVAFRLVWATAGVPQLGLMRFYPHFAGLRLDNAMTHPAISRSLLLGIAATVIVTTATGIAMDRGRAIGLAADQPIAAALADDDRRRGAGSGDHDEERHGLLGGVHETTGNLIVPLVGLHVLYLLLFKRPLARFMLFVDAPQPPKRTEPVN